MSEPTPETTNENYSSQIDPAFSRAFNEVFGNEDSETTSNDPATPPTGGEGEATPLAPVVPAGQEPATTAPATGGETPPNATPPSDPESVPAGEEGAGKQEGDGNAAAPSAGRGELNYADIAPLFDNAAAKLIETSETTLRGQAVEEIRKSLDPNILQALESHSRLLIGESVPSVKGQGTETLRDSKDAEDWQNAVKSIISQQVNTRATALMEEAKPVLSTLQASTTLFRSNKDIVPGTKEYNPALAAKFIQMAGPYLHKVDGKAIGFQVDVQPLLDSIRKDLAANPPAPTARQEQVAGQPRTPEGKWDAPQAGIPSKTGLSGDPEEDFSPFWKTVGMTDMNI